MALSLPTLPRGTNVEHSYVAAGGKLRSSMGGNTQAILRFGDKLRVAYQLPPLSRACARAWVAARMEAEATGQLVRCFVPQLGEGPAGATGSGTAGSVAGTISGDGVEDGMWFSFIAGGRSYLHMVTAGGCAPRLRAALSGSVEMAAPIIEGFLEDTPEWSIDRLVAVGMSFAITEAA